MGDWLSKERNQDKLVNEVSNIVLDILNKLDDSAVVNFIGKKAKEMSDDLKINQIVGNGIEYVLNKNDHQKIITNLSMQIKDYVINNRAIFVRIFSIVLQLIHHLMNIAKLPLHLLLLRFFELL